MRARYVVVAALLVATTVVVGLVASRPESGQFTAAGGVQLCSKGDHLITNSMLYQPEDLGQPTPQGAAAAWARFEAQRAQTERAADFLARASAVEVRPLADGEVAVLFPSDSPGIFLAYAHTLELERGFVVDSAQVCESALFEK